MVREIPCRGVASNKNYKCTDERIFPRKVVRVVAKDFLEWEGLNGNKNYTKMETRVLNYSTRE